jgi:hypothetical protein
MTNRSGSQRWCCRGGGRCSSIPDGRSSCFPVRRRCHSRGHTVTAQNTAGCNLALSRPFQAGSCVDLLIGDVQLAGTTDADVRSGPLSLVTERLSGCGASFGWRDPEAARAARPAVQAPSASPPHTQQRTAVWYHPLFGGLFAARSSSPSSGSERCLLSGLLWYGRGIVLMPR